MNGLLHDLTVTIDARVGNKNCDCNKDTKCYAKDEVKWHVLVGHLLT